MVAPRRSPSQPSATSPASSSHRADHPAPPTLVPRNGKLFLVRWIRQDGQATQQKLYRHRGPAMLFAAKLRVLGKEVAVYAGTVAWSQAGEPDVVDLRIARQRLDRRQERS